MENGGEMSKWKFHGNENLRKTSGLTVRSVLKMVMSNLKSNNNDDNNDDGNDVVVPLGHGDPSQFPCFRTSLEAEDAVVSALRSGNFNSYGLTIGVTTRKAVAEYLSRDLPHKVSPDEVFLTLGCTQAIEVVIAALACPGANILLPRPGFPSYEARCAYIGLEHRYFDLLPDQGWEVDVDEVETLADQNTVALVIINPGNPCGSVYSYEHLQKVAETVRKLGILVITDEVYGHLAFGSKPFVPMAVFANIVPVITLGSISKRWIVPGWRLGWLVTSDHHGTLQKSGMIESIKGFLNISSDPATFIQAALPGILEKTGKEFFENILNILAQVANICYEKLKEIPSITCPHKPEGSMFMMVKLDVALLKDIKDDVDFCIKLAKEENVVVLPGTAVGLNNWLRITFAVEPPLLEKGLERIKAFCERHANMDVIIRH